MTGGAWQSSVGLRLSGQALGGGNLAPDRANKSVATSQILGFGTAAGQMNQLVLQERSLGPGGSETLDLYDGSTNNPALIDIMRDNVRLRMLRSACFWILDGGDAAGVTVGDAASNPHPLWFGADDQTQTIYPSSGPMTGGQQDGIAVTSGIRNVKVTNNGAVSVTYLVALAGSINVGGGAMGVLGLTYP